MLPLFHDVVAAGLACLLSLWLRLGSDLSGTWDARRLALISVAFAFVAGVVFLSLRMYQGIWRYASTRDLAILVKASTLANLVFLPLLFIINRLQDLPRSFLVINWFVLISLLGGPRFIYRMARDRRAEEAAAAEGVRAIPVLLIGAGDAAELFLRAPRGRGRSIGRWASWRRRHRGSVAASTEFRWSALSISWRSSWRR